MESKKDIRRRVLEKRNQIPEKDWKERSCKIYEKVVAHPFFLSADTIYCYVDYKAEVSTKDIIERAWEYGKKVAVPKVEGEELKFFYIQHFSDLEEGYKGILEPNKSRPANAQAALVLMPGVAFDRECKRIGYGKGFYDRFLRNHTQYRTMALAFESQMVERIPFDEYDICPEMIITEETCYVRQITK